MTTLYTHGTVVLLYNLIEMYLKVPTVSADARLTVLLMDELSKPASRVTQPYATLSVDACDK